MKVTGIVAEYNPFHKGHEYHIQISKKITESDYCIVIMSGNFVQRGTPAILDKYTRTRMALLSGADLVLELPTPYACGSAEFFAQGALRILNGLSIVDSLCFGSESGDNAPLTSDSPILKIASALAQESPEYKEALQSFLKTGLSFPKARNRALLTIYPQLSEANDLDNFLLQPNHILGIEYCKALLRLESNIQPVAIKRIGNHYHDSTLSSDFSSASAIRKVLETSDITQIESQLPAESYALLSQSFHQTCPVTLDDFSLMLHYALLQQASSVQSFSSFADVTEDLSDKILKNLHEYRSFSQFCEILKTKDITASRISRSLLHILLGITNEKMSSFLAPSFTGYARILGFRKDAADLLSQLKKQTEIPLISKPADAGQILGNGDCFSLFETETYACNIYNAVVTNKFGVSAKHEYTNSVIIV